MYNYILFDLDGTLSDPKIGICTCVQHALKKMGIDEPDIDKLEPFIGPPLRDSFKEYYQMNDEEAEKAITYYRERFSTVGKYENELYPGIYELLRDLKKKGRKVAIASSKPTVFVEDILNHFEIRSFFDVVIGSELDGSRDKKEDVLKEALDKLFEGGEIEYDETVMIGDRKFDIEASNKLEIDCIGVTYGYGSREELETAGATAIVNSVIGLRTILMPITTGNAGNAGKNSQTKDNGQKGSAANNKSKGAGTSKAGTQPDAGPYSFRNLWEIFGPAFGYWIVPFFLMLVIFTIMSKMFDLNDVATNNSAHFFSEILAKYVFCLIMLPSFIKTGRREKAGELKESPYRCLQFKGNEIVFGLFAAALSVGVSCLVYCSGVVKFEEDYQNVVNHMFELPLWMQIIFFAVLTPVMEQYVFIGLSFRRGRLKMPSVFAMIAVVLLYGLTQHDTSLMLVGFLSFLPCILGFILVCRKLWYPMIISVVSSSVFVLAVNNGGFNGLLCRKEVDFALMLIGVLAIGFMNIPFFMGVKSEDKNM